MKATDTIDAARIDLLLGELRLPGIKLIWAALAETADKEGWPAARFLAALAEQEARASNKGGTVRPNVLAVFILTTNWYFVGSSTGRSAGLRPLMSLSTIMAAPR